MDGRPNRFHVYGVFGDMRCLDLAIVMFTDDLLLFFL